MAIPHISNNAKVPVVSVVGQKKVPEVDDAESTKNEANKHPMILKKCLLLVLLSSALVVRL